MLFVTCYDKRRYAEGLANYIGEFSYGHAVLHASLALFFFPYPKFPLSLIHGMGLWCRDVDFEVRRRGQEERRLIVCRHCVQVVFIFRSSHLEVL